MTKILSKNIFIILIGFLLFFSFFSFLHANSFSTATTNLINNVTIGKTSLSNTINNVNDNISNFSTNISNIGNFSNTNLFNNVSNFSTAQPSSTQSNGTTQILLENYEGLFSTNMQALQGDPSTALTTYIDLIVKIAFGLGSIAAVALIIWGGMDYIGESFTKKTDGKNKIMRGIGAIVLLAVAFIFFQKVNPETLIVRFKPTSTGTTVNSSSTPTPTGSNISPNTNLNSLHPTVQKHAEAFLKDAKNHGIVLKVTETLRTFERQSALYAQGKTPGGQQVTNAKAGQSYHNYGLALDVVEIRDGKAIYNDSDNPRWDEIGAIGKNHGFTWGGDFKSIKDKPHFEMPLGFSISQLQSGKRPPT